MPGSGNFLHLFRGGAARQSVQIAHGILYTQIGTRQDIAAPEHEDQKHLRGPDTDSLDGGQCRNDLIVREIAHPGELQFFAIDSGTEVAHIAQLLRTDASLAELLVAQSAERVGPNSAASRLLEATTDGRGGLCRDLLGNDRLNQRGEAVAADPQGARADVPDDSCQNRIPAFQVSRGCGAFVEVHGHGFLLPDRAGSGEAGGGCWRVGRMFSTARGALWTIYPGFSTGSPHGKFLTVAGAYREAGAFARLMAGGLPVG